jgi:hypothetical protein
MGDPFDRVMARLDTSGECWEDTGVPPGERAKVQGQRDGVRYTTSSYRVVYERLVRPLGDDEALHHLCLNRRCCNPAHLLPCTTAENNAFDTWKVPPKGEANRAKTHCVNGHPFDEENTWRTTNGRGNQVRVCRQCKRDVKRRARERKRNRQG